MAPRKYEFLESANSYSPTLVLGLVRASGNQRMKKKKSDDHNRKVTFYFYIIFPKAFSKATPAPLP